MLPLSFSLFLGRSQLTRTFRLPQTFESVRAQMGIPEPTGSGTSANKDTPDAAAAKDGAAKDGASAAGAAAEDEE